VFKDDDFYVIFRDEWLARTENPDDESEFRRFLATITELFGAA
jgi:hypothetical protein